MINFNSENQSPHEIIAAQRDGEQVITNTNIFINSPIVNLNSTSLRSQFFRSDINNIIRDK
jgi:hypothetical protein